ncbi:MurR/RpiR family transcriptional regulator [Macrococcus hajekii]|uniref:MurR/RpiR family transcriptional regulator n=1 Tax=Macrococcus hajekii TaxID=198482 RepID=A0A4R6BID3_9STAP|nr:MurR/RpiR family transcriptional regulator [Macrococcus hajekii]TDM01379.1 MurR/RpiR family transcriptional regulator [Macrococcus hajekii]GGB11102.1 RpiR family transcriptional regulator [Macrococcus hajekii]
MLTVLKQIEPIDHLLTPVEKRITILIKHHPEFFIESTGKMIAVRAGVSESALIRLSQRIGFSGLRELKIALARDLHLMTDTHTDSLISATQQVFNETRSALSRTEQLINENMLIAAADKIKGRSILIFSTEESIIVAIDFKQKLVRLGYMVEVVQDFFAFTAIVQYYSVIFIVCETECDELIHRIIAASDQKVSILIAPYKHPDVAYSIRTSVEENKTRLALTTGRTIQLTVIDVLFRLLQQ